MGDVTIQGNRFVVTKVYPSTSPDFLRIPGANKRKNGDVALPLNLISWHWLSDIEYVRFDSNCWSWRNEEEEIIELGRYVNLRLLHTWDQPDLWEWQAQALARLRRGSVLLADDRGMGKTRVVIEAIREAQRDGEAKAVIVTSKRLRHVWEVASERWWGVGKAISPIAARWSDAVDQIGTAPITIITYDSLRNEDVHSKVSSLDIEFLVLEEAHNMKKRHKYNKKKIGVDERGRDKIVKTDTNSGLVRSLPGKIRVAVSGTPMPNVWYEIWSLLNFVAPETFTSFWQFVEGIGTVDVNFWGGKEIATDIVRLDIWDEIMDRWIILRDRSGDRRTIWDFAPVVLGSKERKAYRMMQENMRAEMEGEVLDAPNVLAQATRLQQLAGGLGTWDTFTDDNGRTVSTFEHSEPSAKTDELLFRLDGLQRSVVFTRFRDRAEFVGRKIEEESEAEVLLMVGGISEKNQKEMLDRFFDVESFPQDIVAVCVFGTISEGVNELVTASDIFLLDWLTAKDVAQAVDRLDRPGVKHEYVRATVLYSEDTVDELLIDRSAIRVMSLNKILKTPDAYKYLLNLVDTSSEVE